MVPVQTSRSGSTGVGLVIRSHYFDQASTITRSWGYPRRRYALHREVDPVGTGHSGDYRRGSLVGNSAQIVRNKAEMSS